jgi:hypothetical protein
MLSNPTRLEVFLHGVCARPSVWHFLKVFSWLQNIEHSMKVPKPCQNLDDYDTFYVGFYFDRCFVYWWLNLCKWAKEANSITTCLVRLSFTSQTCSLHNTFYVGFYFDRCFVYWWLKLCKWAKEANSIGTCLVRLSFTSQTCSLHIYLLLQHFNNVLRVKC